MIRSVHRIGYQGCRHDNMSKAWDSFDSSWLTDF